MSFVPKVGATYEVEVLAIGPNKKLTTFLEFQKFIEECKKPGSCTTRASLELKADDGLVFKCGPGYMGQWPNGTLVATMGIGDSDDLHGTFSHDGDCLKITITKIE